MQTARVRSQGDFGFGDRGGQRRGSSALWDVPDDFCEVGPLFVGELMGAERVDRGFGEFSELVVGEVFQ